MARVTVPPTAAPGKLDQRVDVASVCDIGPALRRKHGAGRVEVAIKAFDPAGDPITLDDAGMSLHCLWEFARPDVDEGRRRKTLLGWRPDGTRVLDPVFVETGPGTFWVGSPAALYLVGGTPDDVYEVTAVQSTPYDDRDYSLVTPDAYVDTYEPAFEWTLPAAFVVDEFEDLPYVPDHAWGLRVLAGQAQVLISPGGVPIPLDPRDDAYKLCMGRFQVSTGFYEFVGGM